MRFRSQRQVLLHVSTNVRCEWRDTNTCADEEHSLIVREVLASATEWAIDHDTGKDAVDGGRDDLAASILLTTFLLLEVAANGLGKGAGEVTHNTDMDGNIIFLGCAEVSLETTVCQQLLERLPGEGEWMPLEVGNFRARQEDVLASTGGSLFLLDLELHNVGRVLNDLVDIGPVPRADFTKDTLEDPDDAANEPVALSNAM